MDRAWALEEEFWEAGTSGDVASYYARVLAAEAFVVVPGAVLEREDLLRQWKSRPPWTSYSLTDARTVLVNGETVVISYTVTAEDASGTTYRARVSSVYVWAGGGWALTLRQHTPEPENSTDMTLR